MKKTLSAHPYSQCSVIVTEDQITFVSYATPVVIIDKQGYVHALPAFSCSATTRKQVGWFLREYTGIDYQYLRNHARAGLAVHGINGDCIPD